MTAARQAIAAQSEVLLERGEWVVYVEVWFIDGIERRRIGAYRTEAKARLAAKWITWAARREMTPPLPPEAFETEHDA